MRTVLVWLIVLAVVCWVLGAYNRLVRLRAGVRSGFVAVDETMRAECAQLLAQAPASARADAPAAAPQAGVADQAGDDATEAGAVPDAEIPAESESWRSCIAATRQLEAALTQARPEPMDTAAMAMVSTAYQVLEQAVDRLRNEGVYADSRLMGIDDGRIHAEWMNWAQLEIKLAEAIRGFNGRVAAYNTAIHAWPARAIALFLGLRDAGHLSGLRHTGDE